jgi:hypothetical protein
VEVLFRVSLSRPDGSEGLFTGTNLRDAIGKRGPDYYLPSVCGVFRTSRCRKFVRQIVGDLEKGLAWFSDYRTVQDCLNKLRGGQTALGPIQEGKASGKANEFLARLLNQ